MFIIILIIIITPDCHKFAHASIVVVANADITSSSSSYYSVPAGACSFEGAQLASFTTYGAWRGPLPEVKVDLASGTIVTYYPQLVTRTHYLEGVRFNEGKCSFCPYSSAPELPSKEPLFSGGIRNLMPPPMVGPCLDTAKALRMSCVQNQLLHPSAFVGEYYFPDQVLDDNIHSFPWCVPDYYY